MKSGFRSTVSCESAPVSRDLVRPIHRLIADISEFLTLEPGDIVLAGEPYDAPLAQAGDRVSVQVDGLPAIENHVVPE